MVRGGARRISEDGRGRPQAGRTGGRSGRFVDAEFARPPIDSIRAAFGPRPAGKLLEWLFARYEEAPDALFG